MQRGIQNTPPPVSIPTGEGLGLQKRGTDFTGSHSLHLQVIPYSSRYWQSWVHLLPRSICFPFGQPWYSSQKLNKSISCFTKVKSEEYAKKHGGTVALFRMNILNHSPLQRNFLLSNDSTLHVTEKLYPPISYLWNLSDSPVSAVFSSRGSLKNNASPVSEFIALTCDSDSSLVTLVSVALTPILSTSQMLRYTITPCQFITAHCIVSDIKTSCSAGY